MTYEEAKYWTNHNGATYQQESESIKLISKALDKQIPKEPINNSYAKPDPYAPDEPIYVFRTECPCCRNILVEIEEDIEHIEDWKINYCSRCGQKLDFMEMMGAERR